jgi:hypothetical protein
VIVANRRANLRSGLLADPKRHFTSVSRAILDARLRLTGTRYKFRTDKVQIVHPRESAPFVVVETKDKQAPAASTGAILHLIAGDPSSASSTTH